MVLGYQTQETIMRQSVELAIRVAGKPLHQYKDHEDDIFVEGRKGSEYTLHIHNRYSLRVLAVLSVDGLSIMDGKLATPESRGYILGPYASMEIPGWSLNEEVVAKFKFGDKEKSYAALGETQDTSNSGTIGMLVYAEKNKPRIEQYLTFKGQSKYLMPLQASWSAEPLYGGQTASQGILRGSSICLNNVLVGSASPIQAQSSIGGLELAAQAYASQFATEYKSSPGLSACATPVQDTANNLGTEFGESTDFKTTSESFERWYLLQTTTIYYDDARGLKIRGIEVIRNPQTPAPKGNPFPGRGCKPPVDWRG